MLLEAKGIISNDLLWFYEIKFTYMKFLDKLLDLLVLLNNIKEKYVVISIHINTIDKARMFRFKLSVTIKALSIVFMRIVIITYLSFILFRSTRRSSSLSRNFMYVNFITYNHRKSSLMIPFASKSIHCVNLDVSQQVFETR